MLARFALNTGPIIPEQTRYCHLGDTKGLTNPKDYTTPANPENKNTQNVQASHLRDTERLSTPGNDDSIAPMHYPNAYNPLTERP